MGKFTHCCIVTGTTAEALASFYESSGMQAFIFQDRRRDEYVFAEEFFAALLEALKLPTVLVGADCSDVERIYNVDPVAQKMFRHAGSGGVEEDWD